MVNTVLTDKTGTLTRNVMEFFKASIGGVAYGAGITEIERANAARRGIVLEAGEDKARGTAREQYFNFWDARIMDGAWARQPNPHLAREFFRMLALCHTVIPDGARDERVRHMACISAVDLCPTCRLASRPGPNPSMSSCCCRAPDLTVTSPRAVVPPKSISTPAQRHRPL
jgi:hypothetical protein